MKVEHEYECKGARKLWAALDIRTGQVGGQNDDRKRQIELSDFLASLDQQMPVTIPQIHVVFDQRKRPQGTKVQAW